VRKCPLIRGIGRKSTFSPKSTSSGNFRWACEKRLPRRNSSFSIFALGRIVQFQRQIGEGSQARDAMSEVVVNAITIYMYVVLVYVVEGECIPLRAWWLFGSSILAPLAVRKPEPANAARPLRKFCDRHFVNCHCCGRLRSLPHGW
jgi:hypothetical protein